MMRKSTPLLSATQRTFDMMDIVIADGGRSSLSDLARGNSVPIATAHRQVATLVASGFLASSTGGRFIAGQRLRRLLKFVEDAQLVTSIATPVLQRLASGTGMVAQLGTLDNYMVTYRIKAGGQADSLFTRIDMQLEAYCSPIGKVLLAFLPDADRQAYLETGPFVALTPNTIVDPSDLSRELEKVRRLGFAEDHGEIDSNLFCIAMPVRRSDGSAPAAISVSRLGRETGIGSKALLSLLKDTVAKIEAAMDAAGIKANI